MKTTIFLGPPGTGKTTRLLREVADLFSQGYSPQEIAFVSFTKKAATEARERAIEKFDHLDRDDFVWWSTIHSLCYRRLGLARSSVMQKHNWNEVADMTGSPITGWYNIEDGFTQQGNEEGDKFIFHYGLAHARKLSWRNHYESLDFIARQQIPKSKFFYFCETVHKYKKGTGLVDFNDMLELGADLTPVPGVKVLFIDEAQDLSLRQWDVIRAMFKHVEVCVIAGDDDQAIFEWGGANVNKFMSLTGDRVTLDRSYRLPSEVYDHANKIIGRVAHRIDKDWRPDDRQGKVETVGDIIYLSQMLREVAMDPDHDETWMILARNRYLLNDIEKMLRNDGIPYMKDGKRSVDPKDMRIIKAFVSLQKGEDISDADAKTLYAHLKGNGRDIKRGFKQLPGTIPERVDRNWLVQNGGLLVPETKQWWTGLHMDPKKITYYRTMRKRNFRTTEEPLFKMSTIHSVKGGEADNVILLDGMAASTHREFMEVNPDAEHRVQYVGASRAKKRLIIYQQGQRNYYPHPVH